MEKPVIAAVDPLREDVAPAALGLLLARLTGAPLVLAAAYRIDVYVDTSYPEYASASRRDAEQAMSRIADLVARAPGAPTAVTTTVTPAVGSATRALHDLAEREHARLVAIGSSERGRVGRVLPSAVTDRLLHGAPCPVAVAPVGFSFEDAAADQRLIGVAFTDTPDGRAARSTACMLAVRAHGFVRLLTVAEPLHPMMTTTLDAMALEDVRNARDAKAGGHARTRSRRRARQSVGRGRSPLGRPVGRLGSGVGRPRPSGLRVARVRTDADTLGGRNVARTGAKGGMPGSRRPTRLSKRRTTPPE
jgi:nucleotide-binding universal stress UspA family protein